MSTPAPALAPTIESIQRRTVWILVAAQVLTGLGTGSTIGMGAIIAADVAGAAWSGAASTAMTLGAAIAAIPLARAAVARGRRFALAGGVLVAALGSVVVVLGDQLRSFPLLVVGFLFLGAAMAVSLQARFAAIDLASPQRSGRDLSFVVWSTTIGAVIGPNLFQPGAALGSALGIPPNSGPFVIALAAQLAAAAVILIALRPDPLIVARELAVEHRKEEVRVEISPEEAARRRTTLVLTIATLGLAHAVMVAVMSMSPVHLKEHGSTLALVGFVISLHIAGMYALSPLFGWLSDRTSRLFVMVIGYVIFAASVVLVALWPLDHLAIGIALTGLGLGWSAATVAGSALVADLSKGPGRVRIQGRTDMTMSLSGAVAGALAGPALAALGYAGLGIAAGGLVIAMFAIAAVLKVRLGRPAL